MSQEFQELPCQSSVTAHGWQVSFDVRPPLQANSAVGFSSSARLDYASGEIRLVNLPPGNSEPAAIGMYCENSQLQM